MKLYTEEQMFKIWIAGQKYWETSGKSITFEELLEQLASIELPSDEDISIQASNRHYGTNFKHVFASGAKWMKEQILNQNK
jgi:hypothetical protein